MALGVHHGLPSPEELQRLLAQAEVSLFIQRPRLSEDALAAGWYLHGVASSPGALELYPAARQRQAFQVSAHILDLAMQERGVARIERCRLAFGAAIGYRRGGLEPNAMAVYRRTRDLLFADDGDLLDRLPLTPFEVGLTVLGFETQALTSVTRRLGQQFNELRRTIDVADLGPTVFGPYHRLVSAADRLRSFLFAGHRRRLEEAQALLRAAAEPVDGIHDLDVRWVSAHLLAVTDDTAGSSIWTGLPPEVPPAVKQALVLTDPPITTLWEPQQKLFQSNGPDVLNSETRRVVMSLPTSAGKTLSAQLIALTHLATGFDSVCYVAPTRSLGREVRDALRNRVRVVRREMGPDLPDYYPEFIEAGEAVEPQVDVMTPERLGHLVRNDLDGVLNRYGMFIFDEVHLVADPSRGFSLEWVMAMLHWKTRESAHRMILLSAAIGNRAEIKRWIDPDDGGRLFSSDWRGPRRLHAVFYTDARWDEEQRESVRSVDWPERLRYPLEGRVQLRPAGGAGTHQVRLTEPVGTLAFRVDRQGRREAQRHASSTPQYEMNAQVVVAVGRAGPVLVVLSTRVMARQMARAIAARVERSNVTRELAAFVRARLGDEHPLVPLLPYRVAYHHAGLPTDVLEALEQALREERLVYLTATTTLTEGVNLPVRTVVLAETRYEGQDPGAQIYGARLINAMGRAGRATKESEGWVVMCKPGMPGIRDFERMSPADEELAVKSRLATQDALDAAARFEELSAVASDAVFEFHAAELNDFIGFIWLVLSAFDELNRVATETDIDGALQSTLAFAQLDDAQQDLWRRTARTIAGAYAASDRAGRRRWAKAGTSIGTARELDQIAADVAAAARGAADPGERIELAIPALGVLHRADALRRVLALPEAPRPWGFRRTPNAAADIDVSPQTFLERWVAGTEISTLATELLPQVRDRELAVEQIVDCVSEHCEHFLSWTLGVVVGNANQRLEAHGVTERLCDNLPLYVRYGVDSAEAVELITAGLSSRAFALRVAQEARAADLGDITLREWLQAQPMTGWRAMFSGTPADFLDLLEFTRTRGRGLLGALLDSDAESVEVEADFLGTAPEGPVDLRLVDNDDVPRRIGIYRGGQQLGAVSAAAHADVSAVLESGLEFEAAVVQGSLSLGLVAEDVPDSGE
jgi:hypothetical protein